MQPGVTVVLARVWLVVSVGVVGAATLHPHTHLTLDQYSPLPPYRHGVYRRVEGQLDWKDQNPVEDQPFDLSIGPRRSISTNEARRSFEDKYTGRDFILPQTGNYASTRNDFSSLERDKQSRNFAGSKFTDGKSDYQSTKVLESFSREIPPTELEDPFVADDTFQDQGPGSVEIYKLDLFKEKTLLNPNPTGKPFMKSKSKMPKKTSHVDWKDKTSEYKTTSPKIHYKQSNSFDESRTQVPASSESFGTGGVPELQVGCEGLEATVRKLKRSIDTRNKEKDLGASVDPWVGVTPVSLDLDYELSSEEAYEEMDELLKLKRLETTTRRIKQNRGDMEATLYSDEFHPDKRRTEKLPVRGDLGKHGIANQSTVQPSASVIGDRKTGRKDSLIEEYGESLRMDEGKGKDDRGGDDSSTSDGNPTGNQGRKLLWLDDSVDGEHLSERSKRAVWGFGEDEGVVSSDELQTETERRRQEYERRERERWGRGYSGNKTDSEVDRIREEYERMLEQTQRENEERERRIKYGSRNVTSNRWQEEERRREEQRRRERERHGTSAKEYPRNQTAEEQRRRSQEEEIRNRNRWQEEERRRQDLEASRRGYDQRPRSREEEETRRQKLHEEERRRAEQHRARQEELRRREEEEEERKRREQEAEMRRREQIRRHEELQRRRQEHEDQRRLEQRQREWAIKKRQEEEEEKRRQEQNRSEAPSNLLYPTRSSTNDTRRHETDADRQLREREERERDRKLREYVERNRPIVVNGKNDRREEEMRRRRLEEQRRRYRPEGRQREMGNREIEEENRRRMQEQRRRLEEERNLLAYIRRNQPVHVPATNDSSDRAWQEYQKNLEEARQNNRSTYPGTESGRRNHGPSAPTNIDPRNYVDENRRRQEARRLEEERRIQERRRHEEEERRKEIRRREEEARRMQSRRYEEERKRLQAARLEAERRTKELMEEEARRSQGGRTRPLENTRPGYEDRRRFEEHRRRQDPSSVPGNLVTDQSRRAMERERQRQEQERRRLEAARRRQGTTRVNEEHARAMKEQWRRQEEARLNALPVSARIIVRSRGLSPSSTPILSSRTGFGNEIDFSGINPNRPGLEAPRFPASVTQRPPANSPGPCVWAAVHCCPSNVNRIVTCFESMGCPGINWDPNPCRSTVMQAAREEVLKFYAAPQGDKHF